MPDPQGLHRCPVCFKGYKRREHLQRHRSSHTSERPHRCILCSASFQRTDVLKRHLQTCDGSSTASSGRRRACDRCVRQKKACNSLQPCQNCEKRAVQCQYSNSTVPTSTLASTSAPAPAPAALGPAKPVAPSRQAPADHPTTAAGFPFEGTPFSDLDAVIHQAVAQFPLLDDAVPDDWFRLDFSGPSRDPQGQQSQEQQQQQQQYQQDDYHRDSGSSPVSESRGYSFDFLYDFTSRTGLVSSFECATLEQRRQIVASFDQAYLDHHHRHQQQRLESLLSSSHQHLQSSSYGDGDVCVSTTVDHDPTPWSYWLHNPIVIKLQKIVLLVKNVVTVKPNNSAVTLTWSSELEQKCIEFFSPYRFEKFIELYWSVWHPNVSIIHRPTFDPTTSKSILLASMALIGKRTLNAASFPTSPP